jgi:hypothetical protein
MLFSNSQVDSVAYAEQTCTYHAMYTGLLWCAMILASMRAFGVVHQLTRTHGPTLRASNSWILFSNSMLDIVLFSEQIDINYAIN